jgi:hypothetical protein
MSSELMFFPEVEKHTVSPGEHVLVFDDTDPELPWALVCRVEAGSDDWLYVVEWEGKITRADQLVLSGSTGGYRFFLCPPEPVIMARQHLDLRAWIAWCYRHCDVPVLPWVGDEYP